MDSCGMSTIKYILFVFNLLFSLSGLEIIITGGLVLSDVNEFRHFLEGRILAPPIILIVTGTIVFVIAFLGCYGAIKEHYYMLLMFAGALLVIFILELAVGIAAATFKADFTEVLRTALKDSIVNYSKNEVDKGAWDDVQQKFLCCGIDGPSDWQENDPITFSNNRLPNSCCIDATRVVCVNSDTIAYTKGCFNEIESRVETNASILIGVGIGVAFIEVAGIILACLLAYSIKKENENAK